MAVARLNRRELAFAVALLLVGLSRHFLWPLATVELRGVASKGLGAAAAVFLICAAVFMWRSWFVAAAGAWYAFEELQTVVACVWYMVEPWHIPAGSAMASSKAGFDIGAVTVAVACFIACSLSIAISRAER